MKLLLDSSTLIFSFEFPHSNSRIIYDLITARKLQGVISEKAITEVRGNLALKSDGKVLHLLEINLRRNLEVVPIERIKVVMRAWKGKIKEKDLEHLATAKALKISYIVAFDRDFEPFIEYYTPRRFVEKVLKLKGFETEY